MNVLLAEDNPVNQEVAVGLLEVLDCKVTVAENGQKALDAAGHDRFDLILMDCQMPIMDGLEATRAIRSSASSEQRVPIIALTANDIEATREACLAAGMDDLLGKPFTLDELTSLLHRWRPPSHAPSPAEPPSSCTTAPARLANVLDHAPIDALRALDPWGERKLIERAIAKFLEYSDELMERLANAVGQSDATEVARIAHSLKSSSANLGAMDLARQCSEIEKLANGTTPPVDLSTRLPELKQQHQEVKQALELLIDVC
ncbi:MAG: response regulator [Pseudomonadota bacterium]